eukprot:scaffold278062_cov14-Tisochrysis_lutea.AAC.1
MERKKLQSYLIGCQQCCAPTGKHQLPLLLHPMSVLSKLQPFEVRQCALHLIGRGREAVPENQR